MEVVKIKKEHQKELHKLQVNVDTAKTLMHEHAKAHVNAHQELWNRIYEMYPELKKLARDQPCKVNFLSWEITFPNASNIALG